MFFRLSVRHHDNSRTDGRIVTKLGKKIGQVTGQVKFEDGSNRWTLTRDINCFTFHSHLCTDTIDRTCTLYFVQTLLWLSPEVCTFGRDTTVRAITLERMDGSWPNLAHKYFRSWLRSTSKMGLIRDLWPERQHFQEKFIRQRHGNYALRVRPLLWCVKQEAKTHFNCVAPNRLDRSPFGFAFSVKLTLSFELKLSFLFFSTFDLAFTFDLFVEQLY